MSDNINPSNVSELTPAQADLQQKLSLAKQKNNSFELPKPAGSNSALIDRLKTVTDPGVFSRADQRNLANTAESVALTAADEVKREREANEKFKASVLAKRAENQIKSETNSSGLAKEISAETKPVVATVDATGSTILDDDSLPDIPEMEIAAIDPANDVISPMTPPIMSEGNPSLAEIVPEKKDIDSSEDNDVFTMPAQSGVPIAEQFGVADVPMAKTTEPVTPPVLEIPAVPDIAAPAVEKKAESAIAEVPVVASTEPPALPPAPVEPATAVGIPAKQVEVPETSPATTSITHKNISSLPHDSDASKYAGIGGGGVVLPLEEEKK